MPRSDEAAERSPIGVVGIGLLGSALVDRLLAAGFEVIGHDRVAGRARELGLEEVATPRALVERCRRVVICVPDDAAVDEVLFGTDGLVGEEGLVGVSDTPRPELVLDTTTVTPRGAEERARRLGERGIDFVEASVSGSSHRMREGAGVLLVGASEGALAKARDLLDALASIVYLPGPPGAGARLKLTTNLVLGLQRLALAEGLAFGERVGLDAGLVAEALRAGPARSRVLEEKGPRMVRRDFAPEARVRQHLKDVRLIEELAADAGARIPLTHVHRGVLEEAIERGWGDLDNSAVVEVLRADEVGADEVGEATSGGA